MSSAASKRPGEIVSAEQMFNNLRLFLVSLGTFLLLLEKAHPPAGGKAALCWGSAVLLLGVTGRSAGLCPSPFCRQGNRHTATLELPNSQLRPEPQTGVSHTRSAVQALPNHPAELEPCVLLPRAHCKHTSYPCSWNTALLNHSEAPHGAEPLHPVWPLRSRLLFVAIIDPGDVKYG